MIKKLHLINQNKIILDALQKLDKLKIKVLFVVDKNNKIVGSLSEGDIRRSLIKGFNVKSSILPIVNLKPDTIKNSELKNIKNIKNIKKQLCYPIVDNKERIIDVIYLEDLDTLNSSLENIFFIFAGGKGHRLLPLTRKIPKPLAKVDGKPILQILLENIQKQNFKNIYISLNYKKEMIIKLTKLRIFNNLNINLINEQKYLGTAGSLGHLKSDLYKPFFIMNADLIYKINYKKILSFFEAKKSDFVIVGHYHEFKLSYGELKINKTKLISISEKPTKNYLVASGIYLASPKIQQFIRYNEYLDMPNLINKLIGKGLKINVYINDHYLRDISNLESLKNINMEFNI